MRPKWLVTVVPILCFGIAAVLYSMRQNDIALFALSRGIDRTVVLDAGHGGEDGGAAASDGTNEKDINLQITQRISPLFDWFGIRYLSVRKEDILIGNNTLPTIRERKVSDLRRRMQLVNDLPDAVLLSIHQNYYVEEKYTGTQVFYAPFAEGSEELADCIQRSVCGRIQPDNTRRIKPTEGTVFLLDKAEKPSVMVECGFLSNPEERERLKDTLYQTKLAYCIVCGYCEYINNL